jgi:conjugal transfer ATP-binding protein TraC
MNKLFSLLNGSSNLEFESAPFQNHPCAIPHQGGAPVLHKLLPYVSYCEETQLFFNTGSTGFVLLAHPMAGSSLDVQDQLAEFFREKENLIEGSSLQCLLFASPRIGPFLKRWADHRIEDYQNFGKRRSNFLKDKRLKDELGTPLRDFRLLVSMTVPGVLTKNHERERLLRIRNNLISALKLVGLPASLLNAKGLIQEVGNIFNVTRTEFPESAPWNPASLVAIYQ